MGTSAGYMPPSGGDWNSLKRQMGMLLDNPEKRNIVLSRFVTAIGGAEGFSFSNKPQAGGGGGHSFRSSSARQTSQHVLSFFSDVHNFGLEKTIQERGLDFKDKNLEEIKDLLIDYFSEPSSDTDSDASSRAIASVLDELFDDIDTEEELENSFSEIISTEKSEFILCGFYERYIFELFAKVFFEDRTLHDNQEDASDILEIAQDTIKAKIATFKCSYNLKDIDFKEQDGADFVQGILKDILEILEDI